jgi:hypothetical protein
MPYDDAPTVAAPIEESDASSVLSDNSPTTESTTASASYVDSPTVARPDETDAANAFYDDGSDDSDTVREPLNASRARRIGHRPRRMG